jgi:hypothetical protein
MNMNDPGPTPSGSADLLEGLATGSLLPWQRVLAARILRGERLTVVRPRRFGRERYLAEVDAMERTIAEIVDGRPRSGEGSGRA